jgi:hypothetical protein
MDNNKFTIKPNVGAPPQQQVMIAMAPQVAQQVQQIAWVLDSFIELLDKTDMIGIADKVSQGVAKKALFLFMDIKRLNKPESIEQSQAMTQQVEAQKDIIQKRWGQEVLTNMLMDYETAVSNAKSEDGVKWENLN